MASIRLAAATELALASPVAPRDDSVDIVWLDLAEETPAVAASKLRTVVAALAPRLFLQGGAHLIVATGHLEPRAAAAAIAEPIDAIQHGSVAIGVVQGESLIDRLEELALAGCDLRESVGGGRLVDEPRPPLRVWAPTGAGPIVETMAAGASIVLTQAADIGTMAIAAAAEAFAWRASSLERYAAAAAAARLADTAHGGWAEVRDDASIAFGAGLRATAEVATLPDIEYSVSVDTAGDAPELRVREVKPAPTCRRVVAKVPVGWRLRVRLDATSEAKADRLASRIERLAESASPRLGVQIEPVAGARPGLIVVTEADESAPLVALASRLELLSAPADGVAAIEAPLDERVRLIAREWLSEAPTGLLQYGVDVRPAAEWIGI